MKGLHWDKNGLKHGAWSHEEDELLISYITRYNIWNWNHMPKFAGLSRSRKSCRLSWMNYLRPDLKRGNITKEEEEIIVNMYAQMGSRWSKIAARLPGRTDNDIKNYWHTRLKGSNKNAESRNKKQKKELSSSVDVPAEANIVGSNDPNYSSKHPSEGSNESNIPSYIASEGSYSKGSRGPRDMMFSNYIPVADSSSSTTSFRVGFDYTNDRWFDWFA